MDAPTRLPRRGGKTRDVVVTIRLTSDAARVIDAMAQRDERTRSDMVRVLLMAGMEVRRDGAARNGRTP